MRHSGFIIPNKLGSMVAYDRQLPIFNQNFHPTRDTLMKHIRAGGGV